MILTNPGYFYQKGPVVRDKSRLFNIRSGFVLLVPADAFIPGYI